MAPGRQNLVGWFESARARMADDVTCRDGVAWCQDAIHEMQAYVPFGADDRPASPTNGSFARGSGQDVAWYTGDLLSNPPAAPSGRVRAW